MGGGAGCTPHPCCRCLLLPWPAPPPLLGADAHGRDHPRGWAGDVHPQRPGRHRDREVCVYPKGARRSSISFRVVSAHTLLLAFDGVLVTAPFCTSISWRPSTERGCHSMDFFYWVLCVRVLWVPLAPSCFGCLAG